MQKRTPWHHPSTLMKAWLRTFLPLTDNFQPCGVSGSSKKCSYPVVSSWRTLIWQQGLCPRLEIILWLCWEPNIRVQLWLFHGARGCFEAAVVNTWVRCGRHLDGMTTWGMLNNSCCHVFANSCTSFRQKMRVMMAVEHASPIQVVIRCAVFCHGGIITTTLAVESQGTTKPLKAETGMVCL